MPPTCVGGIAHWTNRLLANDRITIGIAVSQSGRYALLGRQVLAGLECYVRDVNAAGGIPLGGESRKLPVVLVAEDDGGDAATIPILIDKLVNESGVDLLMGPYGSGLTQAAALAAEAAEFVLWNHSGSADQIFADKSPWMVGIISPASRYLCVVVDMLCALDPEAKRVALISADTGFATDMADGAAAWIKTKGLTLTTHHRYRSGLQDFRPLLDPLVKNPPDWLLGVGRLEDDLRLAHDLCELRPRVKAVALVAAAIDHFKTDLGDLSEGFLGPSQWEVDVRYPVDCGPSGAAFVANYQRGARQPIDYPAGQGYVAGVIAQRCVEAAGCLDQRALRDAATRLRCTTFYGPFAIDADSGRQTAHPMLVTQWQRGERQIVWPADVAQVRPRYPAGF